MDGGVVYPFYTAAGQSLRAVCLDASGNVFVTGATDGVLRKIAPDGTVLTTNVASGPARRDQPGHRPELRDDVVHVLLAGGALGHEVSQARAQPQLRQQPQPFAGTTAVLLTAFSRASLKGAAAQYAFLTDVAATPAHISVGFR